LQYGIFFDRDQPTGLHIVFETPILRF